MGIKKKYLGLFAIGLILFAIFTTKIGFHDCYEYITIAKYFGGISNINLFSTHSILYPLIIGLFLKIVPTILTIKLINVLWVFLIGIVLLCWLNKKWAFILFATSPLTWFLSVQTTPVLPASFFFLLSFILFEKEIKYSKIYSALCLGLSIAFYTPMILIGGIFLLVYFWDKKCYDAFIYSVFLGIGFFPRLIVDYFFLGNPVYSIMRYFGTNFLISLGMNPNISGTYLTNILGILLIFVGISPLLFKLYSVDFKTYQKEIIFLALASAILLIRTASLKYFFLISPIILILLAKKLTKKEIKLHVLLSIVIIIFLCFGFFGQTRDVLMKQDLEQIFSEYPDRQIVAGPFEANGFAALLWKNEPGIYWFMDYQAQVENKTELKSYSFEFMPNIPIREKIVFSGEFIRPYPEQSYENIIVVSEKQDLEGFNKINCYESLCVYE